MPSKPISQAQATESRPLWYDVENVNVPNLWHEVAVGLWFPHCFKTGGPAAGLESQNTPAHAVGDAYHFQATFSMKGDGLGYLLSALELSASYSADEVDGAILRKFSLAGIRSGIGYEVARNTDELPPDVTGITPLNISADVRALGEEDRFVQVARIYAREILSGRKPAKAVSEIMGVPTSTAGYWIRRAKDLRYLRDSPDSFASRHTGNEGLALSDVQDNFRVLTERPLRPNTTRYVQVTKPDGTSRSSLQRGRAGNQPKNESRAKANEGGDPKPKVEDASRSSG